MERQFVGFGRVRGELQDCCLIRFRAYAIEYIDLMGHERGRFFVSYITRMCLRMMAWCLLPIFFTALVAWPMSAILELPAKIGHGQPMMPDLPWLVAGAGAAISFLLLLVQFIRLWRWENGVGHSCYVCGCLLGSARQRRYTFCRQCLGCGKYYSVENV